MSTTQRPQFTVDLFLTDKAAEQVLTFMDQEGVTPANAGLRVSVLPGGCSGFKYGLNIETESLDDDYIIEDRGVRMFVDAFSAQYLGGTTIDFIDNMTGAGFSFTNPNASGGCGCGSSFSA